MTQLYPLKLQRHPQYLRFGGVKLNAKAHSIVGDDLKAQPLAETWEISDHPSHSSIISNGSLKGVSLRTLMERYAKDLLGETGSLVDGRFPLMVRLLDINENLPPAVHCSNEFATSKNLSEYGKYEAAYVIDADEDAMFYAGNRQNLSIRDLELFVAENRSFETMHAVKVTPGDTYYVPAGRLHSWGKGNLVYEVHTTSNNIYALDWLAWDKDKEKRNYDITQLKECIVFDARKNSKIPPQQLTKKDGILREVLCATNYFILEKLSLTKKMSLSDNTNRFIIYTIIDGEGMIITNDKKSYFYKSYETILVPANSVNSTFIPNGKCIILKAYIGDLQNDIVAPLTARNVSKDNIIALAGFSDDNELKEFV